MKPLGVICSIVLSIFCLSGCGQSAPQQTERMPDLTVEIQNELEDVVCVTVVACDDPEDSGYFSSACIRASDQEGQENTPLLRGQTYRQTIPGAAIQARDTDTIYLKFSYQDKSGEEFAIETVPVTKEECRNGDVQRYLLSNIVALTPMQ